MIIINIITLTDTKKLHFSKCKAMTTLVPILIMTIMTLIRLRYEENGLLGWLVIEYYDNSHIQALIYLLEQLNTDMSSLKMKKQKTDYLQRVPNTNRK